jgi:hypothetical protein
VLFVLVSSHSQEEAKDGLSCLVSSGKDMQLIAFRWLCMYSRRHYFTFFSGRIIFISQIILGNHLVGKAVHIGFGSLLQICTTYHKDKADRRQVATQLA